MVLLISCDSGKYEIEGTVENLSDPTLFAVYESLDGNEVDTIICDQNGRFVTTHEQNNNLRVITFYYNKREQWFTVYPEEGKKIQVMGDAEYPQLMQVKGGHTNNKLSQFKRKATVLLKDMDALAKDAPTPERTTQMSNIKHELKRIVRNFIEDNAAEEASAILISEYFTNPEDMAQTEELINLLSPELNNNYVVKLLKSQVEKAKTTEIGAKAPDFRVTNIYGEVMTPDSFSNKYYILAFTASWCDLCKTEILLLDNLSMKYPADSLGIMLISLDDNIEEVRQMVLNDTIRWNLVTDSAGQAIDLFELYNVSSLPNCFFMDDRGIIRLRTANGVELENTIDEIMR